MKKRLSDNEFRIATDGLAVGEQTTRIARGVLVEGKKQKDFAEELGLTTGAVSQAVKRVWTAWEERNVPAGHVRVSVVVPKRHEATVRHWAHDQATQQGESTMKTIVMANQKGGVGKTADLVHLAFDFYERGLRVALLDLDTQANASYTLADYRTGTYASSFFEQEGSDWAFEIEPTVQENGGKLALIEPDPNLPSVEQLPLDEARRRFKINLDKLAALGFDVCLVDTAPTPGHALVSALYASDFAISPVELETYSIQGIQKILTLMNSVRRGNRNLKFLGMIASKVDGRNPRHVANLAELTAAYPTLMVPVTIGLRSSIADAVASRMPVWHIKKTSARKAAQEMRELGEYVFKKMEIGR